MRKTSYLYLIMYIVLYMLSSCKKNVDTFAPQITITTPTENQQFSVMDSIHVIANVCDDRKLQTIDITVTNLSFVTVLSSPTIHPVNNCYDINQSLPINDIFLTSGFYYLLINASDGVNVTRKFQKVYISGLPKRLKYVIVVTKNGNTLGIHKIDSTHTVSLINTLTQDYCGSEVSSNAQLFYIAGRYNGDVSAYSTQDWTLQWNIPVIVSPPFPYFEAIDVYDGMLYVSYRQAKFEIYNELGNIQTSCAIDYGNYPMNFLPTGNFLITYERSPSASVKQFVIYFKTSYAIFQKLTIPFEVQSLFPKDDDHSIVFTNYNNQGTIKLFTISTHNFWDAYTVSSGAITSVACIDANNYLYATSTGFYWYDYQNTSSVLLSAPVNPQLIVYDETESNFMIASDYHTFKTLSFPASNLQYSLNFADSIINILPVYNKD